MIFIKIYKAAVSRSQLHSTPPTQLGIKAVINYLQSHKYSLQAFCSMCFIESCRFSFQLQVVFGLQNNHGNYQPLFPTAAITCPSKQLFLRTWGGGDSLEWVWNKGMKNF